MHAHVEVSPQREHLKHPRHNALSEYKEPVLRRIGTRVRDGPRCVCEQAAEQALAVAAIAARAQHMCVPKPGTHA